MDTLTAPNPAAGVGSARLDPVLDTSTDRSLAIWHEVLTLQVDHFLAAEVRGYRASAAWRGAASVLEAGCGNGRYLAGLRRAFPAKRYVGVDVSPGLIAHARRSYAGPAMDFAVADFLADDDLGAFDAVVLRFVVQHLADFATVLAGAAERLKPGGSLFIVEPDLAASGNRPETPAFAGMLAAFSRAAGERARLRTRLDALPGLIEATPGWTLTRRAALTVAATGPFAGGRLMQLYAAWTDLCEHQGAIAADYAAVRAELAAWSRLPAAQSLIALTLIEARAGGGRAGMRLGELCTAPDQARPSLARGVHLKGGT